MKENSEFKPVKVRLKIDLVSYPARAEGLGKYDQRFLKATIVKIMAYTNKDYLIWTCKRFQILIQVDIDAENASFE